MESKAPSVRKALGRLRRRRGGVGEGGFGVTLTQVAVVQLLLVTVFHGFPEPFPKGPA